MALYSISGIPKKKVLKWGFSNALEMTALVISNERSEEKSNQALHTPLGKKF